MRGPARPLRSPPSGPALSAVALAFVLLLGVAPGAVTGAPASGVSRATAPASTSGLAAPASGPDPGAQAGRPAAPQSADEDFTVNLTAGESFVGQLTFCAYSTNTEDIVGYGDGGGDAVSFTQPPNVVTTDLAPGACETPDYTVTAPSAEGEYSLVWTLGCYASGGCTWEGPPYVDVTINVVSGPAKSSTETTIDCTPDPVAQGNDTECEATVSSDGGSTPTGTVTFASGGSSVDFDPTICDLVGGSCSVEYAALASGTVPISADYSGDGPNDPSSGSYDLDVAPSDRTSTSTGIDCATPVSVGNESDCTVEVSGNAPSGVVDLSSDSPDYLFAPASCELEGVSPESSSCATVYQDLVTGLPTVTADYVGDDENLPSSGSETVHVTSGSTVSATEVECSTATPSVGAPDDCTAVVTASEPSGIVLWSVEPANGSFEEESCELSAGECGNTFTADVPGTARVVASYTGDDQNAPSNGSSRVDVPDDELPTTTDVSCRPSSVAIGDEALCTANVSGASPSGSVVWESPSAGVGFASADCGLAGGSCGVEVDGLGAGAARIEAAYLGDANNQPSDGSAVLVVEGSPSTTGVGCTPNPTPAGETVSCTATVQASPSDGLARDRPASGATPTGTVNWSTDSKTAVLSPTSCALAAGACSVSFADPAAENVTVVADYGGDAGFAPSSGATKEEVDPNPSPPVYSVTFRESGLPSSTRWYVNLSGGESQSSLGTTISFSLGDGLYPYLPSAPLSGFHAAAGTVTVLGASVEVAVTFSSAGPSPVWFNETGLPGGELWWVNVSGHAPLSNRTTSLGGTIELELSIGPYGYNVSAQTLSWQASTENGTFRERGMPLALAVPFLFAYAVTATEGGLPSGSAWTVSVNGTLAPASSPRLPGAASEAYYAFSSLAPTLRFALPNGTFTYRFSSSVAGWTPKNASGNLTIVGASPARPISSQFTSPPAPPGLPAAVIAAVGGAVALVVVALVAFLLLRSSSRRRAANAAAPPPPAWSPAPSPVVPLPPAPTPPPPTVPPPPPPTTAAARSPAPQRYGPPPAICPRCGRPAAFAPAYRRFYCRACHLYL